MRWGKGGRASVGRSGGRARAVWGCFGRSQLIHVRNAENGTPSLTMTKPERPDKLAQESGELLKYQRVSPGHASDTKDSHLARNSGLMLWISCSTRALSNCMRLNSKRAACSRSKDGNFSMSQSDLTSVALIFISKEPSTWPAARSKTDLASACEQSVPSRPAQPAAQRLHIPHMRRAKLL